jgi:Kef-type K+ transport system membrane component KefB
MVPLKAILIGLKWELFVVLFIVFGLLIFGYKRLHTYQLPTGWRWTMLYALVITAVTEVAYYMTHYKIAMEAIHIEVLLPAFILGVVVQVEHDGDEHKAERQHDATSTKAKLALAHLQNERVLTYISALFMVFVGFSMPPLFGGNSAEGNSEPMSASSFVGHVVAVSVLMVLGKMFPVACYQKEANLKTRFALAMGMCPRGEVGAGVILISLDLGIKGDAIGIAVVCLALNMIMTGGFIVTVKQLVTGCVTETEQQLSVLVPVVPATSSLDKDLGDGSETTLSGIQNFDAKGHSPQPSISAISENSSAVLSVNPPGYVDHHENVEMEEV